MQPLGWIALAVAGGAFGFGALAWRRIWLATDTPTSDCGHVFIGFNEVVGRVEPATTQLRSPITGTACVWWWYAVQRHERQGKRTTWVTHEEGATTGPFWVRDGTGRVLVRPDRATVKGHLSAIHDEDELPLGLAMSELRAAASTHLEQWQPGFVDQLVGNTDPNVPILHLRGRWRVLEEALVAGEQVYLQGEGRLTEDERPTVELAAVDNAGVRRGLRIHAGAEADTVSVDRTKTVLWLALAFAALVTAPVVGRPGRGVALGPTLVAVGIGLVVLAGMHLLRAYNRIVRVREQAARAWSLIEVATAQRAELIPRLEHVVQRAMAYERELQTLLAQARTVLPHQELPDRATDALATKAADAGRQLIARIERHPDLTADRTVAHLIGQLRATEDRVAFARRFYVDALTVLQTRTQVFPDRLLARRWT